MTHSIFSSPSMPDEKKEQQALLVSVYKGTQNKSMCEEHLEELALLAKTYGISVAHKEPCLIRKFDAANFVTEGKLAELIALADQLAVDVVIFDDEISPSQQRNLEKAFKCPVIDRTELILAVFAERAQTKEARLQVELAQVKYQAPRLKRLWTHLSRQAGTGSSGKGGGYLKGEGEKQIEIDRRILKREIDQLQNQLEEVRGNRQVQRIARERSSIPIFSIIGYTNAGKSTLLNALTTANVLVEDKLFATLDTTTRKYTLKNNQEVLLIDTVGFIRKLPHLLVAAFKSTLEEAIYADVLLHLVDVSHPMAEEQAKTTFEVLEELGAKDKLVITVLNKIDKCSNPSIVNKMRTQYPRTISISALNRKGLEELEELMIQELSQLRQVVNVRIPQSLYGVVTEIIRMGKILHQEYVENEIFLRVDLPKSMIYKIEPYLVSHDS